MFVAGVVATLLKGDFSAVGFAAFDAANHKSAATMEATERRMTAAGSRMSKGMAVAGKVGGVALAGGVLAAGVAIAKSVSLAADFEQQLSRLKATTGASAKQMDVMKKSAMDAGAATKFSALDAAKAQVELAKGGLSVQQIAGGGLKAALALAAAGEMDLAEAAGTTVNAMKQFGIEGEGAMHVADALATAANTTTADVDHFAMALTQGGAAAKSAGLNLDETVAILEAFADNSVKGSDAGTSMKTMLTQLANPTGKQKDAAKALNLELWDQHGRLKALPAIARELDGAFGGLTNQQRLAAAATLAGTDGMRGLIALYDSSPAKMRAYLDGLKEEGTAAAVAAEKQDNLKGKLENLKGSLETAAIQLGGPLLDPLTTSAEKATDAINDLAKSGALEGIGEDLASVIDALNGTGGDSTVGSGIKEAADAIGEIVGALDFDVAGAAGITKVREILLGIGGAARLVSGILTGDFGQAFSGLEDVARSALSTILGVFSGFINGIGTVTGLIAKVDPTGVFDGASKAAKGAADAINDVRDNLLGVKDPPPIKIKGDPANAVAALKRVQAMGVSDKVMKILGRDGDAKSKIKALIALGIPTKIARILANNAQALAAVGGTQAAINSIRGKTVEINVIERRSIIGGAQGALGGKKRATGRGPGAGERALTGEGVGAELYGNAVDGFTIVDRPTVVDLRPEDYVVPFGDPAQSGHALGLMLDMLGIKGYAKGKAPAKKPAGKKQLPIPEAVRFGAVPEDELDKSRDDAREAYQKRKDRVHDIDVDIRAQRKRVNEAKAGPARRKAQAKLADLQRDRKRYNDGGGGYTSLAAMRRQWQELQRQATALHAYNRDIERLNTLQETDRTKMATAAKRGDAGAWNAAKSDRDGILGTLRKKYAAALKLAKNPNFKADLESKLAGIESEITDSEADKLAFDSPFEGGLTERERERLAQLQRDQSLAALTTGLDDDQATAAATLSFLETMLGAAQADSSRGGAAAVRDLADQVRQARDNVASFASGASSSNDNANVAAQLAQRDEQLRVAQRESEINAKALATFQGAGDIGSAGWRPSVVVNQTVNTLHPGDPATQRAIGEAAVGGFGHQASRQSPRTNLGL